MWITLALVACTKEVPEDSTPSESCDDLASVSGVIKDELGAPVAGATVSAWDSDTDTSVVVGTGSDGSYSLELYAGDWILDANIANSPDGDTGLTLCFTEDQPLSLADCEVATLDFGFTECNTADKPNLYLYPAHDQAMSVRVALHPDQNIVMSSPKHGLEGWSGIAHPDGTFTQDGERADFLFYEVSLLPSHTKFLDGEETGWCVQGPQVPEQMGERLAQIGFNAREVADYVEAWQQDLPPAAVYRMMPIRAVDGMADLVLVPHMRVERVWFVISPSDSDCALPAPDWQIDREGVHGAEWGVVLRGFPGGLGVVR